jgi:outer membrane protein assembly factor BamA
MMLGIGLPKEVLADKSLDTSKTKLGMLPVVFYSPETRLGIGGIFYTSFKTRRNDSITRKSSTQTYLDVTSNKQLLLQSDYSIFTFRNKFHFKGRVDYIHFPEFYYGIGNNTHEHLKCLIDFNSFWVTTYFYSLMHKNIYAGLLIQHQSLYMLNKTLRNYSDSREIYGGMGYSTSGAGAGILVDNRDNPLNPQKGYYLESNYFYYVNHNYSRSGFHSFLLDLRGYKTFRKKLVLNFNTYLSLNEGEVPFRMMPFIGGPRFLRGFYRGRFRDNNLILAQYEFRYPIVGRLGLAAFSGVAQVAEYTNDFRINDFHYNYGGGLRFKIDRKENANVRIDFGFTQDSHGIYIVFAEAF